MCDHGPMLEKLLDSRLADLESQGLLRHAEDGREREAAWHNAQLLGVQFVDASSNDYLGLGCQLVSREMFDDAASGEVAIRDAPEGDSPGQLNQPGRPQAAESCLQERVSRETTLPLSMGAGASRLIHGTRAAHRQLERQLAHWVGLPDALLFSSGFSANVGLNACLALGDDLIFSDQLNHASIIDGCRLAKGRVQIYPHLDLGHLEQQLSHTPEEAAKWVVTESYFSMDGDSPDLARLRSLCTRHGAFLVVDEAHALGVFGPKGAGLCSKQRIAPDVLVGTLGKAVGAQGAFVAGSGSLRTYLWNRARSFVYSTAPSPLLTALTALQVRRTQSQDPARERLHSACLRFRSHLAGAGVNLAPCSHGPIVPIVLGASERAMQAVSQLASRGILTQAVRPPTVPPGHSRLRITLNAHMSDATVDRLAQELVNACHAS